MRSYYSSSLTEFLSKQVDEIVGTIHSNVMSAETTIQQTNTWKTEVRILQEQLKTLGVGRIIFEYIIPRMGKRVDVVLLYKNIVFLLEFKCGDCEYRASTYDQVYDYALDLRNFQRESCNRLLVPIIVSTQAPAVHNSIVEKERIIEPLKCNASNIAQVVELVCAQYSEPEFDYLSWENSAYLEGVSKCGYGKGSLIIPKRHNEHYLVYYLQRLLQQSFFVDYNICNRIGCKQDA